MYLYEIVDELNKLSELEVDKETGEINLDIEQEIERLKLDLDGKLSNIWGLLKNWNAEIDAISNEIKRLADRKKTVSNAFDRLKVYAQSIMKTGKNWKSINGVASFGWRKSTACKIYDEKLIPEQFFIITKKPDLIKIKNSIKSGEEVSGAVIEEKNNLTIK